MIPPRETVGKIECPLGISYHSELKTFFLSLAVGTMLRRDFYHFRRHPCPSDGQGQIQDFVQGGESFFKCINISKS